MGTWKDGINVPPEREDVLADGFPPPGNAMFEDLLRGLYRVEAQEQTACPTCKPYPGDPCVCGWDA